MLGCTNAEGKCDIKKSAEKSSIPRMGTAYHAIMFFKVMNAVASEKTIFFLLPQMPQFNV